jgi:hypothetical protein
MNTRFAQLQTPTPTPNPEEEAQAQARALVTQLLDKIEQARELLPIWQLYERPGSHEAD